MSKPLVQIMEPAAYLGIRTFDRAIQMIGKADFYILVCYIDLNMVARMIKSDYKERNVEVDAVFRYTGTPYDWVLHGMNNYGPPFIVGTVNSDVKGKV